MSIRSVFVVGAGLMGCGIAQISAQAGYQVFLCDMSEEACRKGKDRIADGLEKRVKKGKLTEEKKDEILRNISITASYDDCRDADLIIEAVYEKEEVKKDVLRKISEACSETAVIATNTSSISIAELSKSVKNPDHFLGMHFFSPVPAMKLLELVKYIRTSDETIETAKEFGRATGKECIVSKDSPAFIVNRMLDPMLNEAIHLVELGVGSIEDIDRGMKFGLNHPMGPLELMDMAGIDVELAVMEVLYRETGDPKYRPCKLLKDMVRLGFLGKKTGRGFYIYNEDGTRQPNWEIEK